MEHFVGSDVSLCSRLRTKASYCPKSEFSPARRMLSAKWVCGLLQRAEVRLEFIGETRGRDLRGDPQLSV
jgi:hypothetical protein